jgi:endonuclease/exonuclease/phosphatase family metal-dependent hydrolase
MCRQNRVAVLPSLLVALSLLISTAVSAQTAQPESPEPEVPAGPPSAFGTPAVLPTIAWRDAATHVGREVYLVGKATRTSKSRTGHCFLNFDPDFRHTTTIFIYRTDVKKFPDSPDTLFRDKLIKVRGFVTDRNGQPNISVSSPDRITILPDNTPLPAPSKATPTTRPALADSLTVGSYNVLNFFDAAEDPYTSDETTGPKPQAQVEALAKSIRSLNADVLALIEVENRGVLQQFVDLYLPDMGYEVVEYEGNDMRGIDTAVLSRVPVGPVTSYRHLRFQDTNGRPTHFQRDLLQVRLEPPAGTPFDLFVVHLKSKGGDEGDGLEIRLAEAKVARSILDEKLKTDPQAAFLIAGDFNDTFDSQPLQAIVGTGSTALSNFIDDLSPYNRVTYNQKPHRSMIDFIHASPAMAKRYVAKSYNIPADGSPTTTGSDHNPVEAKFRLK